MPTKKNTEEGKRKNAPKDAPIHDLSVYLEDGTLDQLLTDYCLNNSIGEIVLKRENAHTAKTYFLADLIFSAVFEQDMTIINQIIQRVDGTTPTTDEKDQYANFTGMAIMDVMDLTSSEQMLIMPTDPAMIAIAKTIYVIATSHPKVGSQARKEKQAAIEIILNRVGGRKSEPVRPIIESRYQEPEWMRQLESAAESDQSSKEEPSG